MNPQILRCIEARDRRDWASLPASFEQDAVAAAFQDAKEWFPRAAVSQRIKASKATTFQELRLAIVDALNKYRPELL